MAKSPCRHHALHLAMLMGGAFAAQCLPAAFAATTDAVQSNALAAPKLMLAQDWNTSLDVAAFLISEKLDGVRAYWDGKELRFRSGRLIVAPVWFTAALPNTALDGELWMGRHRFDALSGAVRKGVPVDAEWREVRYLIFDTPGAEGSFAQRATRINDLVAKAKVPWLQVVEQSRVSDHSALQKRLQMTVNDGGEGLVLHRAEALWQPGRSDALRKLKLQPDEEARVIAQIPGKGRHLGRMGALLLEMPNGQRFALGTGFSDAQRETPPATGAMVTYRYRDRTLSGLPKFASYLRTRED